MPKTGILDQLNDAQRSQLILWIETLPMTEVLLKVAAPLPEGFGISTHITSLRRFYRREKLSERVGEIEEAKSVQVSTADLTSLINASWGAMAINLFQISSGPVSQRPEVVAAVNRSLVKLQEINLRREQIQLARERLELEKQKLLVSTSFKQNQQGSVDLREAGKLIDQVMKMHGNIVAGT